MAAARPIRMSDTARPAQDEADDTAGARRVYPYEYRDADDDERDAWLDAAEELPITHVLRYEPSFTIRVKLPPRVDPDAWLAEASLGWNAELCDGGEAWSEPGGYAWLEIENTGSTQTIVGLDESPDADDEAA